MEVFDTWRSWQGARYFLEHKLSARDLTELEVTFQFAVKCHDRQTRPDGTPYAVHLLEVIEILSKGPGVTDREMLQAAVLHDVVEDTTCSIGEIESRYGQGVANKVDWLTKSPPREGMSKQQIKDEYFERLVSAPEDVITIKLADRLSNVQKLDTHPRPKKQRSYYLETLERILPLARNIDWFSQKFEEWRQHFSYLELEEV